MKLVKRILLVLLLLVLAAVVIGFLMPGSRNDRRHRAGDDSVSSTPE